MTEKQKLTPIKYLINHMLPLFLENEEEMGSGSIIVEDGYTHEEIWKAYEEIKNSMEINRR